MKTSEPQVIHLKDYQKPEDLLGQNGLLKVLQKRLLEKAMGAELTVHLGYVKGSVRSIYTSWSSDCLFASFSLFAFFNRFAT